MDVPAISGFAVGLTVAGLVGGDRVVGGDLRQLSPRRGEDYLVVGRRVGGVVGGGRGRVGGGGGGAVAVGAGAG